MARIMIVDDSRVARRLLKSILVRVGHDIICEAVNGAEAILSYRDLRPDLVTMDVTMPIMDGILSAKRILATFPRARIIMVTSLTQQSKVLEASEVGASDYIVKPYNEQRVVTAIASVLGRDERR